MSKRINFKRVCLVIAQIILVVATILLTVTSVNLLIETIWVLMEQRANNPNSDSYRFFWEHMDILFPFMTLFPHLASLIVLLHSGLYSLKSTPFSKAKGLRCISFGIALIIILCYRMIVWRYLPNDIFSAWICCKEFFATAYLVAFVNIALDIIGTVLHKLSQKRQLKSADSQTTE